MRGRETQFWRETVRPRLGVFGKLYRVENRLDSGMPDVVGLIAPVTFLMELKHAGEWPARADTPLHFNHFGREQVLFQEEWWNAGGLCCTLAQVERSYLLFPPWRAREIAAGATKAALTAMAVVRGHGTFPTGAIVRCLRSRVLISETLPPTKFSGSGEDSPG